MNFTFNTDTKTLDRSQFHLLFDVLRSLDYTVIGPTVRDNAILFEQIDSDNDLPEGWTDIQSNGHYHLKKRDDMALFGYNLGPYSLKKFLHPPKRRLWQADRTADSFAVTPEFSSAEKTAFMGVRSCDLHGLNVQGRVLGGDFADSFYQEVREKSLIIAVNCVLAGGTCFCVSMNAGPKASRGFDIALTEVIDDERHLLL